MSFYCLLVFSIELLRELKFTVTVIIIAWVKQMSCVVDRAACRSILAGVAFLVESVNTLSGDALTSVQRDEQLAANSIAACKFLEDLELCMYLSTYDKS